MSKTHFGKTLATLTAELAAYRAHVAEQQDRRIRDCTDGDCFVSEKVEQMHEIELERAAELAAEGWRAGFVGLCRVDGTTAKGRWVDSKWSSVGAWMTTNAAGERVFIRGELLHDSRAGSEKATAKLLDLGFRWESRRCYADARRYFPSSGLAGMWSSNLVTIPVDRDGRECCADALVYSADTFFVDGAADIARGIAEGDEYLTTSGAEYIARSYPATRRTVKRAA